MTASSLPTSETVTQAVFEIHRRAEPYALGVFVCLAFVTVWMFERFRGIGAGFVLSPGFSAFVFLFVVPMGLLLVYRLLNREPVVAVRGDFVHVSNSTLGWRKSVLPASDIEAVETDWIRGTSHARIVFCVAPKRFAEQSWRGPWIRRANGKLYLDIVNTDSSPDVAVAKLRQALGIREPHQLA